MSPRAVPLKILIAGGLGVVRRRSRSRSVSPKARVPLGRMDARDSASCLVALIGVVQHALVRFTAA
jgi:hypothetical protein